MGCAFCKDPNNSKKQVSEVNERSSLLAHDHTNSATRLINNAQDLAVSNSMTKTDEQSIMSRILHRTAQNIIDVSAIEPHSMERSEYMDKMRHYIEKTSSSDFHLPKTKLIIPSVTHAPMNALSTDPINPSDIKLITDSSIAVAFALSQLEIKCDEPIMETFGVTPVPITT